MEAIQIKEELHQFIELADERVLNLIYGMMKADKPSVTLTMAQQEDLDKRIARHKSGETKSYTWAEARAMIEQRA
jgi:Putative addiction module component